MQQMSHATVCSHQSEYHHYEIPCPVCLPGLATVGQIGADNLVQAYVHLSLQGVGVILLPGVLNQAPGLSQAGLLGQGPRD